MQIARRDKIYYYHSKDNEPAIMVDPGELFAVDTELCSGAWLKDITDVWSKEKSRGPNPTVCIGVRNSFPGDLLCIDILDIDPEGLGYTAILDARLNHAIMGRDMEPCPRTVAISEGKINWSSRLKIPVKPMIGTLGTSSPEGRLNSWGGCYGGNMDVSEITTGTRVYLPVSYEGALVNVGDVHAIQGDGEICNAGGIECRARVKLKASIVKNGISQKCVRAEDEKYLMTIACLLSTDESFYLACSELIRFVCSRYLITEEECFQLASQVMEARCTQYVNPTRSYICKIPKNILDAGYEQVNEH